MRLSDVPAAIAPPFVMSMAIGLRNRSWERIAAQRLKAFEKLHLACGGNRMPGWANVDLEGPSGVIKLDLTRPLPSRTDTLSAIYCEHFIEHIERDAAVRLLKECHRSLRPGGVLRLSTPNLQVLIAEYQAGRTDHWADMHWTPASPCQLINEGMRLWGHRFLFDAPELESVLRSAGFVQMQPCRWQESEHEALRKLECRPFHGELIYECTK